MRPDFSCQASNITLAIRAVCNHRLLIANLEDLKDATRSNPKFPLLAELKGLADAAHTDAQEAQA